MFGRKQQPMLALVGLAMFSTATAWAAPWQQLHGGAGHAGTWDGKVDPAGIKLLWQAGNGLNRNTQPCVSADGRTVFACGNGSGNTAIITAFDADSGSVRWSAPVNAYTDYFSWSSPAYDDGFVYWAGSQGFGTATIYKIDALTGETAWTSEIGGEIVNASPTVANDYLYISTYGGFTPENAVHYALELTDGSIAWSAPDGGSGQGAMAYDGSRNLLYQTVHGDYLGQGANHYLRAYNASTGEVAWTSEWSFENAPSQSAVACDGDRIYVQDYSFSGDGKLYSAEADTGDLIFSTSTTGSGDGCPAIDTSGNIYACGDWQGPGKTRAFDPAGNVLWNFDAAGGWTASPAWADGYVFVGDQNANVLYLLDDGNGSVTMQLAGGGPVAFGNEAFYTIGLDGTLYAYSTVPEPATASLLLWGGCSLLPGRRKR